MITASRRSIVVVGNGMVGHRFCEQLIQRDADREFRVVTFCEEPRAAYDRVGLTAFFAHKSAQKLMLANLDWYREQGIELHIGQRASRIDRKKRVVESDSGGRIDYEFVVLATGSFPFVPPIEGIKKRGVFVYRTIEDLERIIEYGQGARSAAVIGGGLLGLEAAKAAYDLGLKTHVIEFAPRLMPRQIDDAGSAILVRSIEDLGVKVHLNKATKEVIGGTCVEGMVFTDGERLDVDMIIVSAGIRPRDELGREAGLTVGERGGVVVDDRLRTSDESIFAVGEVALHRGMIYGLVAPGYEMAEVVAANLTGEDRRFTGADLSTKLKLMGVDVASFGDYEAPPQRARPLTYEDPFGGVYKKLLFDHGGERLLGGVLVGDASDYAALATLCRSGGAVPCPPGELVAGKRIAAGAGSLAGDAQVCSCNSVTKGEICAAIREQELSTAAEVKKCTRAGSGCGGCLPLVADLVAAELLAAGRSVTQHLCEHFAYARQELYQIVKVKGIRTFDELIAAHGKGNGCEICRPAVASILASLFNENILDHAALQDTNDRFLANVQRGGLYSVVPRVPGGEITPEKLIVLGRVAKKFGLYTKITGGQRIDLFGAQVHQLPDIWEELIAAGFESGHAYGKAMRTVKSCVGSTWCRYGVQDSVGFAIRIEERYRGIRAPHKLKAAVSGCVRECAEAQCKDFGLIATEQGYNLFVCGNGGAKPRHADLLAADLDEETAIRTIDRFLMYYIQTADKLTRTSVWLEKMEGGIDYLRQVVVEDKLGICDELERQMQFLVDSYRCEWKEAVRDPARRRMFRQFVNTDETTAGIEIITERHQNRPADWPKEGVSLVELKAIGRGALNGNGRALAGAGEESGRVGEGEKEVASCSHSPPLPVAPSARLRKRPERDFASAWIAVGRVADFPKDGGAAIKYGDVQIAVFNFHSRGEWYACQNMCPHKNAFILSRGLLGSSGDLPKVACPLHKKTFSLEDGLCLSGEDFSLKTFPVKIDGEEVLLHLPPKDQLDALLATRHHCITARDTRPATDACAACV